MFSLLSLCLSNVAASWILLTERCHSIITLFAKDRAIIYSAVALHSKHTIVKASQHTPAARQMTPRVHLSKQLLAAAPNPPAKDLHRTRQKQLIRNCMWAQGQSKGICACTRRRVVQIPRRWVSKRSGVLCRQTRCQREWNRKLWFCSSSLSTLERNTLFPSPSFLQRLPIHTTNTLTAGTRLS